MLALTDIIKYLSFISYFGFIVSSISGFINISNNFDICKFIISLIVILNVPIIIYIEVINKNNENIKLIHYIRAYIQIIISMLIIGLSHIGVGFGIYGLFMGLSNLMMGVFNNNKVSPIININIEESN